MTNNPYKTCSLLQDCDVWYIQTALSLCSQQRGRDKINALQFSEGFNETIFYATVEHNITPLLHIFRRNMHCCLPTILLLQTDQENPAVLHSSPSHSAKRRPPLVHTCSQTSPNTRNIMNYSTFTTHAQNETIQHSAAQNHSLQTMPSNYQITKT